VQALEQNDWAEIIKIPSFMCAKETHKINLQQNRKREALRKADADTSCLFTMLVAMLTNRWRFRNKIHHFSHAHPLTPDGVK
jgi:hypothetical protein